MFEPIVRVPSQNGMILDKDWYVAAPRIPEEIYLELEDTSKPNFIYLGGGTLEEVLKEVKKSPTNRTWVPMEYVKEHFERIGYKVTVL